MKNVRSSQPCISTNFFSKAQVLPMWVSLIHVFYKYTVRNLLGVLSYDLSYNAQLYVQLTIGKRNGYSKKNSLRVLLCKTSTRFCINILKNDFKNCYKSLSKKKSFITFFLFCKTLLLRSGRLGTSWMFF